MITTFSISMAERLQKQLGEMIAKGGLDRHQAKLASRVAAGVIDDFARTTFKSYPYRYGSSHRSLKGYYDKKGNYHEPRERFRTWAGRKASLRFQTKRGSPTNFWHRSMVKYENGGKGNPSTLSHLIEFGSWNKKVGRFNRALNIRKGAFRAKQRDALITLERGLALAVQNATSGTKMGLVKFRKGVT